MFKLLAITLFCAFAIGGTFWFFPKLGFERLTYGQTLPESGSSEGTTPSPSRPPSRPPSQSPKKEVNSGCETWPNQTISTHLPKTITNLEDDLMKRSLVTVYMEKWSSSMFGTIIARNWILTKASGLCSATDDSSNSKIDNVHVFSDVFDANHKEYTVVEIACHPEFNNFENDIAIIRVKERLNSNNRSSIVPCSQLSGDDLAGYEGYSIGDAAIDKNGEKIIQHSQIRISKIQAREDCKQKLNANKNIGGRFSSKLSSTKFCTEPWTKNMCLAEHGSPLIVQGFIAGIKSGQVISADGQCGPRTIEMWIDIAHHLHWIETTMRSRENKYKGQ